MNQINANKKSSQSIFFSFVLPSIVLLTIVITIIALSEWLR